MNAFEHQREIDELQRLLKKAQQEAAANKRRTDDLVEAVYRAAYEAARAYGRGLAVKRPAVDKRRKKAEIALIHATDWQLGKKTVTYDVATCDRRMMQFAEKVIRITDIQRADHPVKEAVLMLGGDMVENTDLFPGQAFEIEAYLFDQLFETVRIIEKMVRTFAANFETVRVICEYGNHGRLGKYGVNPKGDNVDRMAYRIAADRTQTLSNVSWQMSDAGHQVFEIGNYRGLLVHGDEIRSMGQTPIFAIIKRFTSWSSGVMPDFHEGFMGHYHTPLSLTLPNSSRVYVTGSPESGSVYATETIGALGKPSQRLHFIDPEKAITTSEYVVWLD
jgi:hypothetical protein